MQHAKFDFEFESKYGTFRDAIILPADHGMSDSDIEAIKQARFDEWINRIENPPVAPEEPQPPAAE